MGLFQQFPYTDFHQLNLDWLVQKVKEAYSPENPPEFTVLSVNGETGDVILYKDAIVQFPDVEDTQWNVHRIADGKSSGIQFRVGQPAQRIDDTNRYDIYDTGNPPPYPVTSVNGDTGDVVAVKSVNGATGIVTLYPNAYIKFPDVTETQWNLYRQTDGTNTGIQFRVGQPAQRMDGLNRYDIYDSDNPPPYPVTSVAGLTGGVAILDTSIVNDGGVDKIKIAFPVTSVDGATGAIATWAYNDHEDEQLPIASDSGAWGLVREISTGAVTGIEFFYDDVNDEYITYMKYKPAGGTETKVKLLTPADIPSSAGVVSFNGLTGVVNVTGTDLNTGTNDSTSIEQSITNLKNKDSKLIMDMAIWVEGDTSTKAITAGDFVIVQNSTITGITDGLYKAINNVSAGTSVTSVDLDNTDTGNGGFNTLNDQIANIGKIQRIDVDVSKALGKQIKDILGTNYNRNIIFLVSVVGGKPTDFPSEATSYGCCHVINGYYQTAYYWGNEQALYIGRKVYTDDSFSYWRKITASVV